MDWITQQLAVLNHWRDKARTRGHDVKRISIGHFDGLVLAADDTGAYRWRIGPRGNVARQCLGHPSVALESIVYGRA